MNKVVEYALLADGPSDRALMPIIAWALRRAQPGGSHSFQGFVHRGTEDLRAHISASLAKYRPSVLFVHRDAEKQSREERLVEFPAERRVVPVIPVRMTEAWLLIDPTAIRIAAGNPNGSAPLELPPVRKLGTIPDPKAALRTALLDASGHVTTRKRKRFQRDYGMRVQRVAESISDFGPLLELEAFRAFYTDLQAAVDRVAR